ncbi:alpha/beta hydrolase family protein [Pseudoxanthomonas composti]|uniref:S9 family peptidase n=1 Tax=Pseudoxanthomonas composti TaxID=2137479 RepID=A0A4Q1K063_9GAMM|nr:S9 family peptidase [Pseudoxanthomonas composti]RXR08562.1 S9 family peptidase [Pseudoxanthomonas composti]
MKQRIAAILGCAMGVWASAVGAADLDGLLKRSAYNDIVISPDGSHYAVTVAQEDRTGLAIMRRSDKQIVSAFKLLKDEHVGELMWASNTRLLMTTQRKLGKLDQPRETGELLALDLGKSRPEPLIGYRSGDASVGRAGRSDELAALSVQRLPGNTRNVLVTVSPYSRRETWSRVDRMDVENARRVIVARAPIRDARFYTDNAGVVRMVTGSAEDNVGKLYHRPNDTAEWTLIHDAAQTQRREFPIGFAADNRTAYLQVEMPEGPDAIVAYDTQTGQRRELMRDAVSDPTRFITAHGASLMPVGVEFGNGAPRTAFFDEKGPDALMQRRLERSFPGMAVRVSSVSDDGALSLILVSSDREPGSYFLFDNAAKQAQFVLARREWIDPAAMAPMRTIAFKARDGMQLHGLLTRPTNATAAGPLVVLPHGGPFGIADQWGFAQEVQLLAQAGYSVLQLNYRGSGQHGWAYLQAGARGWGLAMQDDLTDATRWAIAEKIADPGRICIYGASYGAYAALMGAAKEPALYRCAAGYVGVYDLPMMVKEDSKRSVRLGNWADDWVGKPSELAAVSPNLLADRIKVPVFLAAGGEDEVAPIKHSERMEKALRAAGVPVETLYYPTEGHGFYTQEHQKAFYTRLLAFLDRHIGRTGAVAAKPD